jgi:hypothetical protein
MSADYIHKLENRLEIEQYADQGTSLAESSYLRFVGNDRAKITNPSSSSNFKSMNSRLQEAQKRVVDLTTENELLRTENGELKTKVKAMVKVEGYWGASGGKGDKYANPSLFNFQLLKKELKQTKAALADRIKEVAAAKRAIGKTIVNGEKKPSQPQSQSQSQLSEPGPSTDPRCTARHSSSRAIAEDVVSLSDYTALLSKVARLRTELGTLRANLELHSAAQTPMRAATAGRDTAVTSTSSSAATAAAAAAAAVAAAATASIGTLDDRDDSVGVPLRSTAVAAAEAKAALLLKVERIREEQRRRQQQQQETDPASWPFPQGRGAERVEAPAAEAYQGIEAYQGMGLGAQVGAGEGEDEGRLAALVERDCAAQAFARLAKFARETGRERDQLLAYVEAELLDRSRVAHAAEAMQARVAELSAGSDETRKLLEAAEGAFSAHTQQTRALEEELFGARQQLAVEQQQAVLARRRAERLSDEVRELSAQLQRSGGAVQALEARVAEALAQAHDERSRRHALETDLEMLEVSLGGLGGAPNPNPTSSPSSSDDGSVGTQDSLSLRGSEAGEQERDRDRDPPNLPDSAEASLRRVERVRAALVALREDKSQLEQLDVVLGRLTADLLRVAEEQQQEERNLSLRRGAAGDAEGRERRRPASRRHAAWVTLGSLHTLCSPLAQAARALNRALAQEEQTNAAFRLEISQVSQDPTQVYALWIVDWLA